MKKLAILLLFISAYTQAQTNTYNKADSLYKLADYKSSLLLARKATLEYKDKKDWKMVVKSKNLEANNEIRLGNITKAINAANEGLDINSQKISPSESMEGACLSTIGLINLIQGRNDLAMKKFTESLKVRKKKNAGDVDIADSYNNLALAYWNNGNTELALDYNRKSLALRKKAAGEESELTAASLNNLGLIYSSSDPKQALHYYNKAKDIYQKKFGDNHPKMAIAYNNIAIANRNLKKYSDALDMFDKVLAIWQKLYGENHPNVAFTYSGFGQLFAQQNQSDVAKSYYNKALKIYEKKYGTQHPELANTYNAIASVQLQAGEFNDAIQSLDNAIKANFPKAPKMGTVKSTPLKGSYNSYTLLTSLLYKARAFEDMHRYKTLKFKDLQKALDYLELCDELVAEIRHVTVNESDKLRLGQISSEVYEDAIRVSVSLSETSLKWIDYRKKAFYFSEKSKSSVLLEAISESNAKSFANIPPDVLNMEKQLSADIAFYEQKLAQGFDNATDEQEWSNKLSDLKIQYQEFQKDLEKRFPDYYDLKYNVDVASVDDLQAALDEETAVFNYFQAPNSGRLYIFIITKKKFMLHDIKRREDFEKKIRGLRNALEYDVEKVFIKEAYNNCMQLLPKLPGGKINKLIIIPDGKLGTIPFESLVCEKPESDATYKNITYLIKKYAISYDYSTTLYLQSKKRSAKISKPGSIMLCAPVEFSTDGSNSARRHLSDLPGTKSEVEAIEKLFKEHGIESSSYINDMARESLIKSEELKKYKILHFATHGVVNEENPELSEIFLTQKPEMDEDGDLYSGEIYNLEIDADLVCLSACQTGLGKVSKGEGIIGLTRALIYAGSNNLIVSLWTVSDESTRDLMIGFYGDMLEAGKTEYGKSLRSAKLDLIKSEKFSSPYYWAPFILIGK